MQWNQLIEEYLETKQKVKKEYEALKNLLQGRVLEVVNREVGRVTLEDLLKYQTVREQIVNCCLTVLMLETRSKVSAAQRLKGFGRYLKKNYQIDLELDENLPQFFDEKTPRQVDLLKTLHSISKLEHLEGIYNLSAKPLRAELEALVEGRELLGQKVKIERVVTPRGEVKFASTVHPIFLALNLTEVNALTVALKQLGKGTFMEDTYNHLAETIYGQLSEYGQGKIDQVAEPLGMTFTKGSHTSGYRLECEMTRESINHELEFAWKSGECTRIGYRRADREQEIVGVVSRCEVRTGEVFVRQQRAYGEEFRLAREEIIYIVKEK